MSRVVLSHQRLDFCSCRHERGGGSRYKLPGPGARMCYKCLYRQYHYLRLYKLTPSEKKIFTGTRTLSWRPCTSDKAYRHFYFTTVTENIFRDRKARSEPLTGRNRMREKEVQITDYRLWTERAKNKERICNNKSANGAFDFFFSKFGLYAVIVNPSYCAAVILIINLIHCVTGSKFHLLQTPTYHHLNIIKCPGQGQPERLPGRIHTMGGKMSLELSEIWCH